MKYYYSLLLIIQLFFCACSSEESPQKNLAADKVSIRMKWFFAGTMTGWFAGKELDYFKKEGINLTINPGGPDNNSVKLVAAGSDMFGIAGADEVIMAKEKGIPIIAIAVLFKESPIGFISKKASGIKSPNDWNGKTIEVSYGSNAEVQFRALVKKFNIKNFREVPYTFNLTPFIENKVDVSVAYIMDQVVTLNQMGVELNVMKAKDYGINPYGDVVITAEKTLKEKPLLVRRFLDVTKKSFIWSIENPDSAVQYLIKNVRDLKVDNELEVWKSTIPFIIPDSNLKDILIMEENRWIESKNILQDFDFIKSAIDINKCFTNSLL